MSDETYCYPPDFKVLRNRLGIRDAAELDYAEREFVTQRMLEPIPTGDFDLAHLKAIHRHLFQDVYDWAGKVRTVEIAKGDSRFQPLRFIETGMADIHRRLVQRDYLKDHDATNFAGEAARIIGDINHVHPFREGNGRTQLIYLALLCRQAGYTLDITRIEKEAWMAASREAHNADFEAMARCIANSLASISSQE